MTKHPTSKRMGRPPGTGEHDHLVHVRVPDELKGKLEEIRERQLDRPPLSALIRRALAEFVERHEFLQPAGDVKFKGKRTEEKS